MSFLWDTDLLRRPSLRLGSPAWSRGTWVWSCPRWRGGSRTPQWWGSKCPPQKCSPVSGLWKGQSVHSTNTIKWVSVICYWDCSLILYSCSSLTTKQGYWGPLQSTTHYSFILHFCAFNSDLEIYHINYNPILSLTEQCTFMISYTYTHT